MTTRVIIALLIGLMIGGAAARADTPVHAQSWSLGGAALSSADSARITLWQSDKDGSGMSAGVAPAATGFASSGMQTGGFLAWQSSIYRIDATLNASLDGQTYAGVGASVGPLPGEEGTRYGFHIGTAWTPTDHFTLNPASGLGLGELAAPANNVSISLSINHDLTPNLSLIGLAQAQRNFGTTTLDGSYSSGIGRLVVGAGIGYKF